MRMLIGVLLCALYWTGTPSPTADFAIVEVTGSEADIGLSEEERAQVIDLLSKDDAADWDAARASELRYKRVALAGMGMNGLFVRSVSKSDCGATGNCSTWLLHKSRAKFDLVLSAVSADAVGFQSHTTHGFKNVVATANTSAEGSAIKVFAFDGRKYVQQSCYEQSHGATKQVPCE